MRSQDFSRTLGLKGPNFLDLVLGLAVQDLITDRQHARLLNMHCSFACRFPSIAFSPKTVHALRLVPYISLLWISPWPLEVSFRDGRFLVPFEPTTLKPKLQRPENRLTSPGEMLVDRSDERYKESDEGVPGDGQQ